MNEKTFNAVLSFSALAIAAVLGVASFYLGFIDKESPCIICWATRMLMIGIVMFAFLIIRYGPKPRYIAWIILIAVFGMYAAFRHSSGSFAWDIHQGWWAELLGAHTYTWPMVIHATVLLFTGLVFLFSKNIYSFVSDRFKPLNALSKSVLLAFMFVLGGNLVQAFISTGYPPNMGVGNPTRLSFNPDYWYWTADSWKRLKRPVSLRKDWAIEQPDLPSKPSDTWTFIADADKAPLAATQRLIIRDKQTIKAALNAPATDFAYNGKGQYFVATEKWGLYLLDDDLSQIKHFAVLDHLNGANGRVPVGSAFLSENEFGVLGWNKIYAFFKVDNSLTPRENYPNFIEGWDQYAVTARGAYNTVRARMLHISSMAYLSENNSVYTVTVPNAKNRKLIVSRFDKADNLLSEEFAPVPGSGVQLKEGKENKDLGDYYVTGLTAHQGQLYALSKQFSQILQIDPQRREIVAVYAFAGITNPQGILFKNDEMQILSHENGENIVYRLTP